MDNIIGDNCNIEAVCPYYLPDSQCSFTWRRDDRGVAIVFGYDPEDDPGVHWLCWCDEFVTDGSDRCPNCHSEAPWGAEDYDYGYDPDLDFGEFEASYEEA
jgi:hypothetical protein